MGGIVVKEDEVAGGEVEKLGGDLGEATLGPSGIFLTEQER